MPPCSILLLRKMRLFTYSPVTSAGRQCWYEHDTILTQNFHCAIKFICLGKKFIQKFLQKHFNAKRLFRSLYLKYKKEYKLKGIKLYRFSPPPDVFADHLKNPDNEGFCVPDESGCLGSGVLNISPCKGKLIVKKKKMINRYRTRFKQSCTIQKCASNFNLADGAPIALSQPHFYEGADEYINAITGMNPSDDCATNIDIEPVSRIR